MHFVRLAALSKISYAVYFGRHTCLLTVRLADRPRWLLRLPRLALPSCPGLRWGGRRKILTGCIALDKHDVAGPDRCPLRPSQFTSIPVNRSFTVLPPVRERKEGQQTGS
jgi:hypothetical protein